MTTLAGKAKVLVVDDQPANVQILAEALRTVYDVRIANNGARALEIARKEDRPDLILLDVMMPGLDGFAVIAALKRDPQTWDIPVIFVTAQNDSDSEVRALAAGAVDFISKPIQLQIVSSRVQTHLALRQRERECKLLNTELESKVVERTQQLAERTQQVEILNLALEQRALQAEAANQAKTQFLAKINHELRTPLSAIMGFTDILLQKQTDPADLKKLFLIRQASIQLTSTISEILEFTQLTTGNLHRVSHEFDLRALLQRLGEFIELRTKAKNLVYVCTIDPAIPPRLQGDAAKLEHILINLAANAVKFTAFGGVNVRVSLVKMREATAEILFEIQDTGIGIAADKVQQIFMPFEQADNSYTREYAGVGLGLSINQKLLEMLGGKIGVKTELGTGSTFWFSLSFNYSLFDPIAESGILPLAFLQGLHTKPKVLLADDDFFNQSIFGLLLDESGLAFDVANDGAEALAMATAYAYDLILMDVQMPLMDGLTATRELRKQADRQQTPIIAISANAFAEDQQRCLAAGMNAFLGKPVPAEEFYKEFG